MRMIREKDKIRVDQETNSKDLGESPIDIQIFTSSNSGLSKYGLWELERILNDPNARIPRGNFRIVEVPVDQHHELFEEMRVYVVPTTIVGNQRIIGIPDERMLEQALNQHLARLGNTS